MILALLVIGCATLNAQPGELQLVGTLGNSGIAGDQLLHMSNTDNRSGLYIDDDWNLWLDGGDAIVRTNFQGALQQSYSLAPACIEISTWNFTTHDQTLYFLGYTPKYTNITKENQHIRTRMALFALPMKADGKVTLVTPLPEMAEHRMGTIAARTLGDDLIIASEIFPTGKERKARLQKFNLRTGKFSDWFETHAAAINGIVLDETHNRILIGGQWDRDYYIVSYDMNGKEQNRVRTRFDKTVPTSFRGVISLAGGAVWDTAWYGFLSRYDTDLTPAPGVVQYWNHSINYPTQLLDLPINHAQKTVAQKDAVLIGTTLNTMTFLAQWDRDKQQFTLQRHFGSMPNVRSVGISDTGWITAGADGMQLWWQWDDGPTSPPRHANASAAMTGGWFYKDGFLAPIVDRKFDEGKTDVPVKPGVFKPTTQRASIMPGNHDTMPFFLPVGYAVLPDAQRPDRNIAYCLDARSQALWKTTVENRLGMPSGQRWEQLSIDMKLSSPTDLTALSNGRLAIADGDRVLILQQSADRMTLLTTLQKWGESHDQHLGDKLRLAGDEDTLVVSDTSRHRVLCFDARTMKNPTQFGKTDSAGNTLDRLDQPGAIAVCDNRVLVFDAINERLLKLTVFKF